MRLSRTTSVRSLTIQCEFFDLADYLLNYTLCGHCFDYEYDLINIYLCIFEWVNWVIVVEIFCIGYWYIGILIFLLKMEECTALKYDSVVKLLVVFECDLQKKQICKQIIHSKHPSYKYWR